MTQGLRIDAIKFRARTSRGEVGRTLSFSEGLNLLRADNSSGKSTALQGIVFALGLEGMLSPSHRVPLTHAMTARVALDGVESEVLESDVQMQITNGDGRSVTLTRSVVSATRDNRLITVVEGPDMTSPGDYATADYFVRVRGSAQNDAGFHRYLASFLGLRLPSVSKYDGSEIPLYLETVFPYFFVEQKHGWSGIEARIPAYFGIRDVSKRTAEFVLGLEAFDRILLRQRVSSNLSELEVNWQQTTTELFEVAKAANVIVQDPPGRISQGLRDGTSRPVVSERGEWIQIDIAAQRLRAQLQIAASPEAPSVGESASRLESSLAVAEVGLQQALGVAGALADELDELIKRAQQVSTRIENLREDLRRHQDSQLLERFGSVHAHALLADHICPTCHQHVEDGLDVSAHAMSIAENIDFIQRQIATFEATGRDLERVIAAVTARRESVRAQIIDFRTEIRVTRESLTSSNSALSVADISRRLGMEDRVGVLLSSAEKLNSIRETLLQLTSAWLEQKRLLDEVSGEALSLHDQEVLSNVERSVRVQLRAYGFQSLNPDEIDIDRVSYRPTHEGFDLGFDLSASDMIRAIWAYLFALLQAGVRSGNHLGLLIFDEPKQQDTARASYQALLAHASEQGISGSQVIFATSEDSASLLTMLGSSAYNIVNLEPGEKLLLPLS